MRPVSTLVAPDVVGVPLQHCTLTHEAVAVEYRTGYRWNVPQYPAGITLQDSTRILYKSPHFNFYGGIKNCGNFMQIVYKI
jgi:hypothetical protein